MNWIKNLLYSRIFILTFAAIIIVMASVFIQQILNQLKEDERQQMDTWASAIRAISYVPSYNAEFEFLIKIISENRSIPCILINTDENKVMQKWNVDTKVYDTEEKLRQLAMEMNQNAPPIAVYLPNNTRARMYYGTSRVQTLLQKSMTIIALEILFFVGLLTIMLRTTRLDEKNRLWIGLAKETAHQLGTPITSLLGWLELLRDSACSPDYVAEMEKDAIRLQKVSFKFSQIGAIENVQHVDVVKIAREWLWDKQQRCSKHIILEDKTNGLVAFANVNVMLWEWVIDNLIKNSLDAIGQNDGRVELLAQKQGNRICVDVRDTGQGITAKRHSKIFKHGYTTKEHGWGVGLSLCYRIVHDMYHGKIFVLSSSSAGTTIRVMLKLE